MTLFLLILCYYNVILPFLWPYCEEWGSRKWLRIFSLFQCLLWPFFLTLKQEMFRCPSCPILQFQPLSPKEIQTSGTYSRMPSPKIWDTRSLLVTMNLFAFIIFSKFPTVPSSSILILCDKKLLPTVWFHTSMHCQTCPLLLQTGWYCLFFSMVFIHIEFLHLFFHQYP